MLIKMNEWESSQGGAKAAGEWAIPESKAQRRDRAEVVNKASALAVSGVEGSAEASYLWVEAQAGNPYLGYCRVIEAGDKASKVQLPQLESVPALSSAAKDPASDGATGEVPALADQPSIDIQHYDNTMRASPTAAEDFAGFSEAYTVMVAEQLHAQAGANLTAAIKAHSGIAESKTGVASGLPTAAQINKTLADWLAQIPAQYWRYLALFVSPQVWALLSQDQRGELTYGSWNGIDIQVAAHLDAGTAAGDMVAVAGDFWHGLVIAMRREFRAEHRNDYAGGGDIWYGSARFGVAVLNQNALARLVVGA